MTSIPDFQPSGNQGAHPDLYELENRALDPTRAVLAAMRDIAPWTGRDLLDLGCGSGFWLSEYVVDAATVTGVEPDERLLGVAAARDSRVRVVHGSAEHFPLSDSSTDVTLVIDLADVGPAGR